MSAFARGFLAAVALAAMASSGAAAPAKKLTTIDWTTALMGEGAFSAAFPASLSDPKTYTEHGITARAWSARTPRGTYIAIAAPASSASAPATVNAAISAIGGKLVAEKTAPFPSALAPKAHSFWFSLPSGASGEGVLALGPRRSYALLAITDHVPQEEVLAARFLASLTIPASAKATEALPIASSQKTQKPQKKDESVSAQAVAADSFAQALLAGLASAPEPAPMPALIAHPARVALAGAPKPVPTPVLVAPPARAALMQMAWSDDIPDPHADVSHVPTPPAPAADRPPTPLAAPAAAPDPAPAPEIPAAPPSQALTLPPSLSLPPSADLPEESSATDAPGESYASAPPAPTHWIWLPNTWRWTGSTWEWVRGRWALGQ